MRHDAIPRLARGVLTRKRNPDLRLCLQCPHIHHLPAQSSSRTFSSHSTPISADKPYVRAGLFTPRMGFAVKDQAALDDNKGGQAQATRAPRKIPSYQSASHSPMKPYPTSSSESSSGSRDQAPTRNFGGRNEDRQPIRQSSAERNQNPSYIRQTGLRRGGTNFREPLRKAPPPQVERNSEEGDLLWDDNSPVNRDSAMDGLIYSTSPPRQTRPPQRTPPASLYENLDVSGVKGSKVGWKNFDFELRQTFSFNGPNILSARSPLFQIKACPAHLLNIKPPPFPPHLLRPRKELRIVSFGFIARKTQISKLAVERTRAVRRLKGALNLVVNEGVGSSDSEKGWDLISERLVYVAIVNPEIVQATHTEIVDDALKMLKAIKVKATGRGGLQQASRGTRRPQGNPFRRRA